MTHRTIIILKLTGTPPLTLASIFLLILALGLSTCNKHSDQHSQNKGSAIELPPPPPSNYPSRPSRPNLDTDANKSARQQVTEKGAFAPHPTLEKTLNSTISNSLFPFSFDQPGEMAPPRQLVFSGVMNTSLAKVDFPFFEIHIWSNDPQYTDPVFRNQLTFEQELPGTYSFQQTTPSPLTSGLYYYLVKDENGKLYYANKVIVDY